MRNKRTKNTVRYYLLLLAFLSVLFFSNDFGLIDVQKTAIVMAAGIDRDEEGFVLTSQIAVPQSSKQGKATEAVQLVSKGKTIAQAFEAINAKTGWYPKLVFCNLVVFGEKAAQENVFDALDFFLRDEYLTDDCQLAVCRGTAKALLNTAALVDPSSATAISKVLSPHAERVGTVRPTNLKDFSIGYFGDSQSSVLPVLKKEKQQEKLPEDSSSSGSENGGSGEQSAQDSGESGSEEQGDDSGNSGSQGDSQEKPVFSAKETALFVRGRWRATLTEEETFALQAATGKLRLASYSVDAGDGTCTLTVRRNNPKLDLKIGEDGRGELTITLNMIAGVSDYSKAQGLEETKDGGSLPVGAFAAAEKKLAATLVTAYEKARAVGCDVFALEERLVKYKRRKYHAYKDSILTDTPLSVTVRFESVR